MDLFGRIASKSNTRFQRTVWGIKLALLCMGLISTLVLLKSAIPYSFTFMLSILPPVWISFRSWLAPPYLYLLLNFIIIGIAASSTYHHHHKTLSSLDTIKEYECQSQEHNNSHHFSSRHKLPTTEIWPENNDSDDISHPLQEETSTQCDALATSSPPETKPSISSTKTYHRTLSSTLPSSLSVATKAKKRINHEYLDQDKDTMDSTWKAITQGRGKLQTKQLKKSDTLDVPPPTLITEPSKPELRKSETFNDGASGGGLRRECSLSQDELNRRVEAFIDKVKFDMRLQREDSDNRYLDMINPSVY